MDASMAEISLIVPVDTDPGPYADEISASGGRANSLAMGRTLPDTTTGLMLAGDGDTVSSPAGSDAVLCAVSMGIPVLGIGWGMHAINEAFGGDPAVTLQGRGTGPAEGPDRYRVFLAPGAKLSYTIGGSGWVTIRGTHRVGITEVRLAPDLLASAIAEDRVIEAVELPGRNWVIGVQWSAHLADELPSGFDNVLLAFVERAGF